MSCVCKTHQGVSGFRPRGPHQWKFRPLESLQMKSRGTNRFWGSKKQWKCLDPISGNVRNQVWMSPELLCYANSEYAYAIFPIALALFWEMGGKEICLSRPLSVIFEILSHFLSATDTNNYSVRTKENGLAEIRS